MAAPTPIAAFGQHAPMAEGVRAALVPEYDVVHTCLDAEAALAELPALFGGSQDVTPASKLGSNVERAAGERKVPVILFFGAGIPEEVQASVAEAVKERAPEAKFAKFVPGEIETAGSRGAPDFGVVGKMLKEKFAVLLAA